MGLTLVNLSGFQLGIESAETGINVQSFACRYFLQFKTFAMNFQGQKLGFGMPDKLSREVTLNGHVTGNTGIMAAVWATALTVANDIGTFLAVAMGSNAGGLYVDEITENQTNEGFRAVDLKASSDPLVT